MAWSHILIRSFMVIHDIVEEKWCLFRYSNDHVAQITKADKDLTKRFDFKGINFPVKIRHIDKIEKKNSGGISVFGFKYKEKYPFYVPKQIFLRKICWFFEMSRIKNVWSFMYRNSLNCERKIMFDQILKFCKSSRNLN